MVQTTYEPTTLAPVDAFFDAPTIQVRLFRPAAPKLALWLAVGAFATGILTVGSQASGQIGDTASPAVVGDDILASRQFVGVAAGNGVVVRGGPSVSELAVTTLDAGEEVVVIHRRGDFLRILPPANTFCLVPKARVNIRGTYDGEGPQVGRVSDDLSVRVGSTLNATVGSTALRLSAGDEVKVIGEENIYYKIEPPKMVFFYVPVSQMKKGREVRVEESPLGWAVTEVPTITDTPALADESSATADESDAMAMNSGSTADEGEAIASNPEVPATSETPEISETPSADGDAPAALAQAAETTETADEPEAPVVSALTERIADLDAHYTEQTQLPLDQQPLESLEQSYTEILAEVNESNDPAALAMLPVLEARLKTITIRRDALADLQAMRAMRDEVADRQASLEAEREELADRSEQGRVTVYDAVGQLDISSLQFTDSALFRLVDPQTRRTIIYLRLPTDRASELASHIGQFIGVKGSIVDDRDRNLRYLDVADSARVNPDDVFGAVAAKLIPPSMVQPAAAEAPATPADPEAQQAAAD